MDKVLNKTLFAMVVLICIFILGITPSMIISLFITMVSDIKLYECIETIGFILFSVVGIIISAVYIIEEIRKSERYDLSA